MKFEPDIDKRNADRNMKVRSEWRAVGGLNLWGEAYMTNIHQVGVGVCQ
jgi:hypothetical protein